MSKVVISGFYGFHNIGDEAILLTLTQRLKAMNPNVDITVLSKTPEETTEKFKVRAVDRNNFFKVLKAILSCDVLLSGGGSLLQDYTSARSIHYYLAILRMGLLFRKKVFLISNGIGPLVREKNRKRVAKILNKICHSTVRDENSKQLLLEIGVAPQKVSVSIDLVIGMEKVDKTRGKEILDGLDFIHSERQKVAIAIRQKDFRTEERRTELVNLANQLSSRYNVIFVPFYYKNDTKIVDDLKDLVDENVYFIKKKYNSTEFMSLVQNMDLLVGSRLHSLIFALVAEVPFVGISYDPKIENFLDMIDRTPICKMETFSSELILKEINHYFEDYAVKMNDVLVSKKRLQDRLLINDALLRDVI